MTELKYCTKCLWSVTDKDSSWTLRCVNDIVNSKDPWALSSKGIIGSSCREEREKGWLQFPACGIKGKQFKLKLDYKA